MLSPLLVSALLASPVWADDSALVTRIIAMCNQVRQESGARPVAELSYLNAAAAGHSREMATLKYFSHTSPTVGLERPKNRIENAGGWDMSIAENIYRSVGVPEAELAVDIVDAFMNSPVHRANLLNPKFNSMGIGIARVGKNEWAVTQLFSLQTVALDSYKADHAGANYDVQLKAHVVDGAEEGAVFFAEKPVSKFTGRSFESTFQASGEGKVAVGQKGADGQYSVELEFPVGAKVATPVRTEVAPFETSGKTIKSP